VNAYITDINDWAEFNAIYAEYFGGIDLRVRFTGRPLH
jgi:hypothetical protein